MTNIYSINPSNEHIIKEYESTSRSNITQSIQVAVDAWQSKGLYTLKQRKKWLTNLADILTDKKDYLAQLIAEENGKPLWEAITEVTGTIAKITTTIKALEQRIQPVTIESPDKTFNLNYKPVGVIAVIGPFNFPFYLPMGQIIPALLTGNSIVFKPSEYTIGVGIAMMDCLHQANIPKQLVQLIIGDKTAGNHIVENANINGILFTGSYKTAQHISAAIADQPQKLLAIECGGNNPLILESFADSKTLIECLTKSAFLTSGQRCTCTRRLIMIKSRQNQAIIDQFASHVGGLKLGGYLDQPEPFYGPLISKEAAENVVKTYQGLLDKGAKAILKPTLKKPGFFVSAGIVDTTDCYEWIPDEECFGPLLQVIQVNNLNQAIDVANQTKYGLSASIITQKKSSFEQVRQTVNAGLINWNHPTNGSSSLLPFGGVGCSGNFRPVGYWTIDQCVYPVASVENNHNI